MTVYLAARYSRRSELAGYALDLLNGGHTVVARWLHSHNAVDGDETELRALWAAEDMEDLSVADVVISFTEQQRSAQNGRGGRHVEFGMALALGKRVIVVGHRENVFHCLPQVEFYETWAECWSALLGDEARIPCEVLRRQK